MANENLSKDIEKLIEKKVEKRVKQELSVREQSKRKSRKDHKDLSRRSFLKKLGASAIGIGALSIAPVSGLKISENSVSSFQSLDIGSGSEYFRLNDGGPIEVNGADLDITSQSITGDNGSSITLSGAYSNIATGGNNWNVYDTTNDQSLMDFVEGGPVEIKNVDLEVRSNKVTVSEAVIVAADNSKKKHLADYVCDGTDDQQEIQSALNEYAQDTGRFVKLLEGDYYISNQLNLQGRGLRGQSMHGTVLHATDSLSGRMIYGSNNHAIGLECLQLHGHRSTNSGSYIGIQPSYRGSVRMQDVMVRSFPASGISNEGSEGQSGCINISNCKIKDNGEHGIFLRYYYNRPHDGPDNAKQLIASGRVISSCSVKNNGQNGSQDYDNIWIGDDNTYGSRYFNLVGNYIERGANTRYGIHLHGRTNGTHILVANNFDAGGNTANLSDNASNVKAGNNY